MKRILLILSLLTVAAVAVAQPQFSKVDFSQLPGWGVDETSQALQTLLKTCPSFTNQRVQHTLATTEILITANDWQQVCHAAAAVKPINDQTARQFFQTWFQPYAVSDNANAQGLFTGYYSPELLVSKKRRDDYTVPIYTRPAELVTVNLGRFNPKWQGIKLTGTISQGELLPYYTREQIDQGAIQHNVPVLCWTQSRIDRFFADVQGSAVAVFPNGKQRILIYAGENGQPYVPIGKYLIEQGIFSKETMSADKIKQWLQQHPQQADQLMQKNPSFVFFQWQNGDDPTGTLTAPLVPNRSIAVDNHFIPLGVPVWVTTKVKNTNYNHLLLAVDTGGAIVGAVRGDIYFGSGNAAEDLASGMRQQGRYWILIPKTSRVLSTLNTKESHSA